MAKSTRQYVFEGMELLPELPFYRQYLQIAVPRGDLKWLSVQ